MIVPRVATGEIFILKNGGQVVGKLLNPDETPRQKFVIELATGGQITLDAAQVDRKLFTRPEEMEYEKVRPQYPDTVEGQWALAQWCYDKRLLEERKKHLERICELDPNHVDARQALGYQNVGGRWITRDQRMAEMGYKFYKGRYRTPQEIELMERRRKDDLAEKEWYRKINTWRGWLFTDKDAQGRQSLMEIADPYAVEALEAKLKEDEVVQARLLFVEILARIGTPDAVNVLAQRAIEDPVDEVRLTCLDYLAKVKHPVVTEYFIGKLKSKDNNLVNLAGVALGKIGDPSAVGPLIDALITPHKFKEAKQGGPGSMTTTFGTGPGGSGAPGGGGLAMGGSPRIFTVHIRNQAVLDALVALTGQNFNFNDQIWRYWHTNQQQVQRGGSVNARRD
jgi:hypothetical protein